MGNSSENNVVVFTPADKSALQAAINKWYEIANGSDNGNYSSPLENANSVTKEQYDNDSNVFPYYGNPNTWDVSGITDMSFLFYNKTQNNYPDISTWDVSYVRDMSYMFYLASAFNQPIGNWNTSSVTNMRFMFRDATAFNQDINTKEITAENSPTGVAYTAWDVSSVRDMSVMFFRASAFNQPIGNWNTSAVTNMFGMFYRASAFNKNISIWQVNPSTNLSRMFFSSGVTSSNSYGFSIPTPTYDQFNKDPIIPILTINGANPYIVRELGATYIDPGATYNGEETVETISTVDTSQVGTYTVTYSVTSNSGNTITAIRKVEVKDTVQQPSTTQNTTSSVSITKRHSIVFTTAQSITKDQQLGQNTDNSSSAYIRRKKATANIK